MRPRQFHKHKSKKGGEGTFTALIRNQVSVKNKMYLHKTVYTLKTFGNRPHKSTLGIQPIMTHRWSHKASTGFAAMPLLQEDSKLVSRFKHRV